MNFTTTDEFDQYLTRLINKRVEEILDHREKPVLEKKFLTKKEVCDLLNITLPTLDSYCRKGLITRTKIGNRVLFDETKIQSVLDVLPVKFSTR